MSPATGANSLSTSTISSSTGGAHASSKNTYAKHPRHKRNTRECYLDNLRGILMVMGIVLHAAAGFSSNSGWLINYPSDFQTSTFLNGINAGIHSFRMPLFFMVAGYFAMLVIGKVGGKMFIQQRLLRIALPLLVCMLTFNAFQSWILSIYEQSAFVALYQQQAISHLWFLVNLIVYSFLLFICVPMFSHDTLKVKAFSSKKCFFVIIASFPFFVFPILVLGQIGVPIYQNIPVVGMPYYLYFYFCFFVFGLLLQRQTAWLDLLQRFLPLWGFLYVLSFVMKHYMNMMPEGFIITLALAYIDLFNVLCLCLCLWGGSMHILAKHNVWLTKLADASYSIYLIHHCLVVTFVLAANYYLDSANVKVSSIALFVCCMVMVFTLSYVFHVFVVKKIALMRLLFNGK